MEEWSISIEAFVYGSKYLGSMRIASGGVDMKLRDNGGVPGRKLANGRGRKRDQDVRKYFQLITSPMIVTEGLGHHTRSAAAVLWSSSSEE